MTRTDITIAEIVDRLEQRLEALVYEFWPAAARHGSVIYPCPGKDDLGSFQVYLASHGKQTFGRWNRYSQKRGGNVLNLIAYGLSGETEHKPESYASAILWAKQWLGLERPETDAERRRREERAERQRRIRDEKRWRDEQRAADHVAEIWNGSRPIDLVGGDPVVTYLTGEPVWRGEKNIGNRGFDLGAIPHFCAPLRYHPDLWHWKAKISGPAMVAAIIIAGKITGVHCTWLDPAGVGKARLAKGLSPKLMRGDAGGGIVPITLGPTGLPLDASARAGLRSPVLLVEGIETSIALACGGAEARIWACLSIGNIGVAPVGHDGISEIIVAVENDTKPQALRDRDRALEDLEQYRKPVLTMRSHVGSDFADLY